MPRTEKYAAPWGAAFWTTAEFSLLVLFLAFGDHLLGDLGGNLLVVAELRGEGAAPLGHGSQVDGVFKHLCHGDLRPDHLHAAPGLHAQDPAALFVQIAHHITHKRFWNR